jgi:hypothetical protein
VGAIKDLLTGDVYHLEVEYLIGRAPGCSLRLLRSFVSAQHARLSWGDGGWQVRDLISRNGTFVDEQRLPPGSSRPLLRGARIAFGTTASRWELVDESPPDVLATSLAAPRQVVARHGLMAIPSCDDPRAMLYRNSDGRWVVEKPNESITPISAMQTFELGAEAWRFSCPPEATDGPATDGLSTRLAHIQLNFLVSSRDEPLQVQVAYGNRTIDLEVADCDRLLLALARRRMLDAAQGIGEAAGGWVYEDELAAEPAPRGRGLNADICRIRQQFSRTEVLDPGTIVARRPRTRQLRIGTERIAISTFPARPTRGRGHRA